MAKKEDNSRDVCILCCGLPLLLILMLVFFDEVLRLLPILFWIGLIVGIIALIKHIIQKHKQRAFEREQTAKGLIKFKDQWGTSAQVKRWMEIDTGLNNNFASLNPYQFEEFIAKLFRKMGYDARKTRSTGDFGADVIAKKGDETVLIEVKKYSYGKNVTPKEVQRTLGALHIHNADIALFITTSDFTKSAREVEKNAPIELWNKEKLHQIVRKYFIEDETNNKPIQ